MFSFSCVCIFTFKESVKFSRSLLRECLASNPLRHCSISKENEVSGTECPIISEKNSLEQKYEKYVMVSYSAIFIALAQFFQEIYCNKKIEKFLFISVHIEVVTLCFLYGANEFTWNWRGTIS